MCLDSTNEKIQQDIEEINCLIEDLDGNDENMRFYLQGQIKALEYCSRLFMGVESKLEPLDEI